MKRAIVAWSGGKDAFMALGRVLADPDVQVEGLLTTVTEDTGRVAGHHVRTELVATQARMLGLPLRTVALPAGCVNEEYDRRMGVAMEQVKAEGMTHIVHGDIHLDDVRAYRDERLSRIGLTGHYPLWGEDTTALARRFLERGHEAVVVAVDGEALGKELAGRAYDGTFLHDLPEGVDPCGEKGEFHTFVHNSPVFRAPIPFRTGAVTTRDGRFHTVDLVPGEASSAPSRNPDLSGVPLFERD